MHRFASLSLLLAACGAAGLAPPEPSAPPIAWRTWSPGVFAEARRENRLVFVNGSIEGCMACRWMEATTYRNAQVRSLLASSFIAVTVDADAQPDIGQRLERWAWPALVFFSPDGELVHAIRGNKQPRNFIPVLEALIAQHEAGTLDQTAFAAQVSSRLTPLEEACENVNAEMTRRAQPQGGWGRQTIVRGAPPIYAFLRASVREDEANLRAAMVTAEAYAGLVDSTWGGAFLESTDAAWTQILYEKRTRQESDALRTFLRAAVESGDDHWLERAQIVARHLRDWMRRSDGVFYTYQEDQAPRWPRERPIAAYFALDDEERRSFGVPPIDRTVYTDVNAAAILAFAELAECGDDADAREVAELAAESLLNERWREGWMAHVVAGEGEEERMVDLRDDGRMHLRSQVHFGLALLALARISGDGRWVEYAEAIAGSIRALQDSNAPGYFSAPADGTESLFGRQKSLRDNFLSARFLTELAVYAHAPEYRSEALSIVEGLMPSQLENVPMHALGQLALATESLALGHLQFTVVGAPDDPRAQALYRAALANNDALKTVRFQLDDEGYPAADVPVLYVCTARACSTPIEEPNAVANAAARFQPEGSCGAR